MFFTPETLQANRNLRGHWADLWANRDQFAIDQKQMIETKRHVMTEEQLACNALAGPAREFWAEIDRQIIELRDQTVGMEIVNDLLQVQTVLPVGKTARLYNVVGDIADDVSVSIDGQAPYSFDHTDYGSDGDPIPVFLAGYGANWRHTAGLSSAGIDQVLDSQRTKMRKYNREIVKYTLDGNSKIQVNGYPGQGARNHRNTIKIDLGASGANINLTTATAEQLIAFFGTGVFGQTARANRVAVYTVMWVSYDVWANLNKPYVVNGQVTGTVLAATMPFAPVTEIRPTYALSGNEFLAYVRSRDVVSPLVGMATGVTPLPRPMPNTNYNFQIMGAMGIQVARDAERLSGVVYGGNLTGEPA